MGVCDSQENDTCISADVMRVSKKTSSLGMMPEDHQSLLPALESGLFKYGGTLSEDGTSCSEYSQFYRDSRQSVNGFDGLNKRIVSRHGIGLEILKAQIHHGADPREMRTHGDRTCLMFAVLGEDFSFIKELIELGVDVNQTNHKGETALGFANEMGRDDIAQFLRRNGARC